MQIQDQFRVNVPVEEAWHLLLDLERIAPCMPGAQLQEVEGDEYRGVVKVKVGPITAQYKGAARFTEIDDESHRAVIRAEGRDTRGQGNASATITATLEPDDSATRVSIDSDVTITGKVAQFGRGVIADVSSKLLGQFVENLERDLLSKADAGAGADFADAATEIPGPGTGVGPAAAGEQEEPSPASGIRKINSREAQPVDLLRTAGAPILRRVAPLLLAFVIVIVVVVVLLR